jgi:hypothetical protein
VRIPFYPPLWADPSRDPIGRKPEFAFERLRAPRDVQQSFVPAGLALVHRWDLITLMNQLVWRTAQSESRLQRLDKAQEALRKIAAGEGYYGAQARELKNIARQALGMPLL